MLALLLAASLAATPQDTTVDRPVFTDAAYRVSLPRPDDRWVFIPAAERGTLTVIFHPRGAALSDHLWGALILTRWDGPVPLDEIADRRVEGTWRPAYGRTFTLLARDSLELAGFPAIHLVMGGAVAGAVVDVEEYLVARDSDLVVLQLRLPRGEPRDTLAAGYQRVVGGLDLRWSGGTTAPAAGAGTGGTEIAVTEDQLVVTMPESLMAVGPGVLTSQVVSGGRRQVRWTPDAPGQSHSLLQVGRYTRDDIQVGRLHITVWRLPPEDSAAARVTPELVAAAGRAWAACWQVLGPVPRAALTLVETPRRATLGATGIVLVGRDANPGVLAREVARTWWGGYVRPDPAAPTFVQEWLPSWTGWLIADADGAGGDAVREGLRQARAVAGDARLREALRALVADGRDAASAARFLSLLEPGSAEALREFLP